MMSKQYKAGDLRVWWIPQVPMNAFKVDVSSVEEGVKLLETLASYDLFQLENNIKPDFSNAGGLSVYCEGDGDSGWDDWYDEETGEEDPAEWLAQQPVQQKESAEWSEDAPTENGLYLWRRGKGDEAQISLVEVKDGEFTARFFSGARMTGHWHGEWKKAAILMASSVEVAIAGGANLVSASEAEGSTCEEPLTPAIIRRKLLGMKHITSNADLIPGRYYWCRWKHDGKISLERCGVHPTDNEWKYVGTNNHIWAKDDNKQALERWDIVGPVPEVTPIDFDAYVPKVAT